MSLWSVSKLFHMHNQDIRHAANQMLQFLVLFLAFIAFHLDHLWLTVKTHTSIKIDMNILFRTLYTFRFWVDFDVCGEAYITFWEVKPIHIDPEVFALGYPVNRNIFLRNLTTFFEVVLINIEYQSLGLAKNTTEFSWIQKSYDVRSLFFWKHFCASLLQIFNISLHYS